METNAATHHLPRFWSDMIIFDHTLRENLLSMVLRIAATYYPSFSEGEVSDASKLGEQYSDISWKIWLIIENQDSERLIKVNWSGQMLGDLITVLIKSGKYARACEIMKKLVQGPEDVIGVPSLDSLRLFLDAAIEEDSGSMSLVSWHITSKIY